MTWYDKIVTTFSLTTKSHRSSWSEQIISSTLPLSGGTFLMVKHIFFGKCGKIELRIKWITILLYNSKTTLFGFPHVILSRLLIVCCAVLYLRVCEEWWATCCAQADHRPSSPAAEAHLSATQQEKLVTNKKPTHISIDSLKLFTKFHYHFTHIMNEMNTALLLVVFLQRVVTMEFSKKQIDIFLY